MSSLRGYKLKTCHYRDLPTKEVPFKTKSIAWFTRLFRGIKQFCGFQKQSPKKLDIMEATRQDVRHMGRSSGGNTMNVVRNKKSGAIVVMPGSAKDLRKTFPESEILESEIKG